MTRIFHVTVQETMEGGQKLAHLHKVVAEDLIGAIHKVQDKLEDQPDHLDRYEVISAGLAAEAE